MEKIRKPEETKTHGKRLQFGKSSFTFLIASQWRISAMYAP